MKIAFKALVFLGALLFIVSFDFIDQTLYKIAFVSEAEAIIGAPLTPMSAAGVARRTTRRVVATEAAVATTSTATATAAAAAPPPPTTTTPTAPPPSVPIGTVVQALPGGCETVVVGGVNYSDCSGVFYKAAFQGNNLVYVVVEKPI